MLAPALIECCRVQFSGRVAHCNFSLRVHVDGIVGLLAFLVVLVRPLELLVQYGLDLLESRVLLGD